MKCNPVPAGQYSDVLYSYYRSTAARGPKLAPVRIDAEAGRPATGIGRAFLDSLKQ